jgi:hypothetical protein
MKVSYHAAERFLERVMGKQAYSHEERIKAYRYLELIIGNIIPSSFAKPFVLPGFESFHVIHKYGVAVTIIPKGDCYVL